MPEADWWLCDRCQSLNNLSARKCYSCYRPKPKGSRRASQYLNYVPVITWDKKVRFEEPPSVVAEIEDKQLEITRPPLPPLRDPVSRSITDVAPQVPYGVRITYRAVEPPPPPRMMPGPAPDSPLARVVGAPSALHPSAGPPQRLVPVPVGPPGRPPEQPRPVVAVPIEAGPPPQAAQPPPVAASWAHWNELLDVPTVPDADRLRRAFAASADGRHRGWWSESHATTNGIGSEDTAGTHLATSPSGHAEPHGVDEEPHGFEEEPHPHGQEPDAADAGPRASQTESPDELAWPAQDFAARPAQDVAAGPGPRSWPAEDLAARPGSRG
jgi:hypothetical protein